MPPEASRAERDEEGWEGAAAGSASEEGGGCVLELVLSSDVEGNEAGHVPHASITLSGDDRTSCTRSPVWVIAWHVVVLVGAHLEEELRVFCHELRNPAAGEFRQAAEKDGRGGEGRGGGGGTRKNYSLETYQV